MPKSTKIGALEPIAALNRVCMEEAKLPLSAWEPLVDIREFCPDVQFTDTLCPYLRVRVAEMLNRAQASLKEGMRLRVHTALRTLSMQKRGWDNYYKKMQEEHPEWRLSTLRRATNRYYAPYDQKAPPGHCTGGAVDVKLLDKDGKELDLIAPTEGWEAAYTWSDKISEEAKRHRMIMVHAMLEAGFSNCREEYWHYSWGDSAWAVRVGETVCPYGWIHPPVRFEPDSETVSPSQIHCTYTHDDKGKAVRAEGDIEVSEGNIVWRVGLLWADGVPLTLRIHLPSANSPTPTLFLGENRENWQPVSALERNGKTLTLSLTPQADRLSLTNASPLPNSAG